MKKQIKILLLAIIIIIASAITVNAADATANLRASSTSLKKGDTFTVTLSAEYADGINGIEGLFSYDEDKLELVTKVVEGETISVESAASKWINLGVGLKFEVMSTSTATSGDIVKATFRVKDDAEEGTTAKVTVSGIVLYTFDQNNSEKDLGTKEVEISIPETLKVNIDSIYEQLQEGVNKYLNKINPATMIKNLLPKIQTNGTIEIFKGNQKITDQNANIGTGMLIRIFLNNEEVTFKSIIKGDTNGDGQANFTDILNINSHRLNKTRLNNEFLKAGDVTGDGEADFKDILRINSYRLEKIQSL